MNTAESEIVIDTTRNTPNLVKDETVEWARDHGTRVEIEMQGTYKGGRRSVVAEGLREQGPEPVAVEGRHVDDRGRVEGEQAYIFVEVREKENIEKWGYELTLEIVRAIHERLGIRPARVLLVKPRSIPRTYNGKIQHVQLRELYVNGSLREQGLILYPDY